MNTLGDFANEIGYYKLIAFLAEEIGPSCDQFGKTLLQKSVYLLQELYGLETGYSYEFYNYGTYSQNLADDLETANSLKIVSLDENPQSGVHIRSILHLCEGKYIKECPLPLNTEEAVEKFKNDYSRVNRSQLELHSTIVYIERDLKRKHQLVCKDEIIRCVHLVKPHFTAQKIEEAMEFLREKKRIQLFEEIVEVV